MEDCKFENLPHFKTNTHREMPKIPLADIAWIVKKFKYSALFCTFSYSVLTSRNNSGVILRW